MKIILLPGSSRAERSKVQELAFMLRNNAESIIVSYNKRNLDSKFNVRNEATKIIDAVDSDDHVIVALSDDWATVLKEYMKKSPSGLIGVINIRAESSLENINRRLTSWLGEIKKTSL